MTMQQLSTVAELLVLLIVVVALVVVIVRMRRGTAYRCAVGLALTAVTVLFWVHGAVGIIGDPADLANLMYAGVLAVGIVAAFVARFEPHGMSLALFATALAQGLVAAISLLAELDPAANTMLLVLNGFLVVLFLGSALLFRRAAREQSAAVA